MKTIVEFPDKGVLAEEAAEWLIRLDADTPPSKQELRALGEWLHRSPAHRDELENLAGLWNRMNVLTELAVLVGKSDHRDSVAARHSEGAACGGPWLRHAAVAVVVVGAYALGLAYLLRGAWTDDLTSANGLYATAVGQQTTTELPDGSKILLNTNSQIRVDYGEAYRKIHLLQGEALFTVAKDGGRPFRVYAGSGRIQALGTAFSVYLKDEEIQVMVSEGRVELASTEPPPRTNVQVGKVKMDGRGYGAGPAESPEDEWVKGLGTVSRGQVATIRIPVEEASARSLVPPITVEPISAQGLAERLAWRDGILMFSGDPLEDVVKEVSRYTTISIEIPDPAIRNLRIGGRFPVGETETMLAALESNFHLRVSRLGHNRVVLSAAED